MITIKQLRKDLSERGKKWGSEEEDFEVLEKYLKENNLTWEQIKKDTGLLYIDQLLDLIWIGWAKQNKNNTASAMGKKSAKARKEKGHDSKYYSELAKKRWKQVKKNKDNK